MSVLCRGCMVHKGKYIRHRTVDYVQDGVASISASNMKLRIHIHKYHHCHDIFLKL